MTYLWLKAFHVAAVLAFVGGMLAEAVLLGASIQAGMNSAQRSPAIDALWRWDRTVTTPAMLLTWALGLGLALRGGWFSSVWLPLKLILVVALSGLHGVQSGTLRRMVGDAGGTLPPIQRLAGPVIVAMAGVIAVLVVVKPF